MKNDYSGASPNLAKDQPGANSRLSAPEPGKPGSRRMTRRQFLARGTAAIFGAGLLTGGYVWQGSPTGLKSPSWSWCWGSCRLLLPGCGLFISAMFIWASIRMPVTSGGW